MEKRAAYLSIECKKSDIEEIGTNRGAHLFPEITPRDITRQQRKFEILINLDCCDILPNKINQAGLLQLIKNQFGYCLRGSHRILVSQQSANHVVVKIHLSHGTSSLVNDLKPSVIKTLKHGLGLFFQIDSLGTNCCPKFWGCRLSRKCTIGVKKMKSHETQEFRELFK